MKAYSFRPFVILLEAGMVVAVLDPNNTVPDNGLGTPVFPVDVLIGSFTPMSALDVPEDMTPEELLVYLGQVDLWELPRRDVPMEVIGVSEDVKVLSLAGAS